MSKPTWRPEIPEDLREQGVHLCHCCGWRSAGRGEAFCERCRLVAREAPPQSPRPKPLRVPPMDHPSVRRKGYTPEQQAWIDSILPATCKRCGAVDHTSEACSSGWHETTRREATT